MSLKNHFRTDKRGAVGSVKAKSLKRAETPTQPVVAVLEPVGNKKAKKTKLVVQDAGRKIPFPKQVCESEASSTETRLDKTFRDIPDELLMHILSFLPKYADNLSARAVCRRWRAIAKDLRIVRIYFQLGNCWRKNEQKYSLLTRSTWVSEQPHLRPVMRNILVDWLVEVHHEFGLSHKTLHLAVSYLDRLLIFRPGIIRHRFQLYGLTCLWVASKFEDVYTNSVHDLVWICDDAYTVADFEATEREILAQLDWNLSQVTSVCFLNEYLNACDEFLMENIAARVRCMSLLLVELSIVEFSLLRTYMPSLIAAAAIFLSRRLVQGMVGGYMYPTWLADISGYFPDQEPNMRACVAALSDLHQRAFSGQIAAPIMEKYRLMDHMNVGAIAPLEREQCMF